MAKILQFRRYNTTALANTVGANGELIIDSSNGTISVHNGVTSGGKRLATETYVVNTANQLITAAVPTRLGQLTNDFGYITTNSNITGGSATAIRLFTPRYINGVAFDGSANIEVTISSANLTVNVSESLAQSAFAQANTASNTASSAQANTIILQGVDTTQNTRLSVIEGGLISSNANTVFLNSLITTNNTRIAVVEGGLITANANTMVLQGVNTAQNTRMSVIEGGLITANANSAYLQSIINTANTNITAAAQTVPQNAQSTNYTLQLTDAGKHIYYTQATSNTLYIPTTANVAFSNGTTIMIVSRTSSSANVTVSPNTGVSMYLAGNTTSASRNVTTYGMATLIQVAANTWFINGTGVA